jgi:ubiquinone/menaquinone biosynthesis C-methylase UbiE
MADKVAGNYAHGSLLGAIEGALEKMGKCRKTVSIEDLGPVDEFHIGGRIATAHFAEQLKFSGSDHLLDVGCGLGGAARFFATEYKARVSGIDLTDEYVETGNALNEWMGLSEQIQLRQGSALELPYEDSSFDGAYMLHVGMNIEDKGALFREVGRVLKPGAVFGVFDVMRTGDATLEYPVPWAFDHSICHLAPISEYQTAMSEAGFETSEGNSRQEFAMSFFEKMKARLASADGPPPLGLHTLMQASTPVKIQNMVAGISAGAVAPVELLGRKK